MSKKIISASSFVSNLPEHILGLAEFCQKYPLSDKILLNTSISAGNLILQNLTRSGTNWINFRSETPISYASTIIAEDLIKEKLTQIGASETLVIIDWLFSNLADNGKFKYFEKRTVNAGIVDAIAKSVVELRFAGIFARDINVSSFSDKLKADDVILIAKEYEKALLDRKFIDEAGILVKASDHVKNNTAIFDSKIAVLSRTNFSFLEKMFLSSFKVENITVIRQSSVYGVLQPYQNLSGHLSKTEMLPKSPAKQSIITQHLFDTSKAPASVPGMESEIYSAVGFGNEIKHIFRKALEADTNIDKIEIVSTDNNKYLPVFYSVCEKIKIPFTVSNGWHAKNTSTGKALLSFLYWIKEDFTEVRLRRALEKGYISTLNDDLPGYKMAKLLRGSGAGWGRHRYNAVFTALITELESSANPDKAKDYIALSEFCSSLFLLIPEKDSKGCIQFGKFCEGCIKFLKKFVKPRNDIDVEWRENVVRSLETSATLSDISVEFDEAVNKVIALAEGIKAGASGPKPGAVHFSDLSSGLSGREYTFITGLDESRFPGTVLEDPILLDEERIKISANLITSQQKLKEKVFCLASAIADVSCKLTASWNAYDPSEGRNLYPSSVVLQLYRLISKTPAGYKEMLGWIEKTGASAGCISDSEPIDETDWWFKNLVPGQGNEQIQEFYPNIKKGSIAFDDRNTSDISEYAGFVKPESNEFNPCKNTEIELSASRIETAAKCPYQYFLSYILGIRNPEDVEKNSSRWLGGDEKGTLLHSVFEEYGKLLIKGKEPKEEKAAKSILDAIVVKQAEALKKTNPPASEHLYDKELLILKEDAGEFLSIMTKLGTKPDHCEFKFGKK
jgi:ATP-dependent helicase/nuclease subunit B